MVEKSTISPGQVEIEHTTAGPIIHFFPDEQDVNILLQHLMEGIYILHSREADHEGLKELLRKHKDDPSVVFIEKLLDLNSTRTKDSENYASNFIKKMKHK